MITRFHGSVTVRNADGHIHTSILDSDADLLTALPAAAQFTAKLLARVPQDAALLTFTVIDNEAMANRA